MNKAIAATVGAVGIGAVSYPVFQLAAYGTPIVTTISNAVGAGISMAASANPLYRNDPNGMPTTEQVEAWCRKVRRPSADGILIRRRVRTLPYINARSDVPCDLMGFIARTSSVLGIGVPGASILAVLLSVETWAGVPGKGDAPAMYNWNAGNFKLSRAQAVRNPTVPCWFLVDRVPSLDFYPSFDSIDDGLVAWKNATFGNSGYNQYGTMNALLRGDIRAFCKAIGMAGYARMYAENPRAMDARAHWLMKTGRFVSRSGKATIDPSVGIVFNERI